MMNSFDWQTTVATPPMIIQGLTTVWPPVTDVPPSSAASLKPLIMRGVTFSLSWEEQTTHATYIYNSVKGECISRRKRIL